MVEGGADLEFAPVQLVDESGRVGADLPRCCADAVAGHGLPEAVQALPAVQAALDGAADVGRHVLAESADHSGLLWTPLGRPGIPWRLRGTLQGSGMSMARPIPKAHSIRLGACAVEDLDGAGAPVDPDPVAAVQACGGVAAADDGGDAEFAGHDRGVRERRAHVGDDRGGAGKIGVQPMLVTVVTRISPSASWAPSSGVHSTRAVPSTTPAAPGNPVIASSGPVVVVV